MARRERDNKFLRLTGLWPNKNNKKLYTGKLRAQDVGKLIDKLEEADGNDIAFFLWENDAESRKDPVFTLQCTVSDSGFGGKKKYRDEDEDRSSRRSRRDRDEEEEEEEEQEEEQEEDEDDEPKKTKGTSKASTKASKGCGKSKSKKDEDW